MSEQLLEQQPLLDANHSNAVLIRIVAIQILLLAYSNLRRRSMLVKSEKLARVTHCESFLIVVTAQIEII